MLARLARQPSPASVALTHTNLHPGHSLQAYLDRPALRDALEQISGNVLLGVPSETIALVSSAPVGQRRRVPKCGPLAGRMRTR